MLYAPDRMIVGILFLVPSVCLFVNFNLRFTFWTVRDRDFIFGMHTPLMTPFKWHQGQWPSDLDFDFEAKNSFLDCGGGGGGLLL